MEWSSHLKTKHLLRAIGTRIIPPLAYGVMRLLWWSCKKRFHTLSPIGEEQHVCVCWHGELLMSPQAYRAIHPHHPANAIVSSHFDGSLIANTLNFLGIKPLRGSSRKGAQRVLLQAFKHIKAGEEVLITPDGPKGPRHSMSDGAIGIALKSQLPIFVMNFQAKAYWQMKSWDHFIIPKPFTTIDFYLQSLSLEGKSLPQARDYLQAKMLEHTIRA